MKIVYDAVPRSLFDKLKNLVEGNNFPWYYFERTAAENMSDGYSFSHVSFHNGINSQYSDFSESCLLSILDKIDVKIKKLIRIRIGLITMHDRLIIHAPHVDDNIPHKVGLLYLNDSDGDTIIYNEKYDVNCNEDIYSYYQKVLKEKVSVKERSTPKENKFIMFDGLTYHSSSTPVKTKRRIAINYTFETYD